MTTFKYILFDLDGTLTDSATGITRSVQYALKYFGVEAEPTELTGFIGPPLQQSFREKYSFNEVQAREAIELYRDYYRDRGIFENRLYPGIVNMLEQLKGCGTILSVATAKPTVFAKVILEHFLIDHYFSLVIGSNLDGSRTEKEEIIESVIEKLPITDRSHAVMVGDRRHDLIGARANELKAIAVTYGYGSIAELKTEKPAALIQSVPELTQLLLGNADLSLTSGKTTEDQ